jgi:hypothetical protein
MSIIIGLSGKKQSGKSSLALFLKAYFELKFNQINIPKESFVQSTDGSSVSILLPNGAMADCFDYLSETIPESKENVKIYSFADPIKEFCVHVLGIAHEQVYGTDEQKNSPTDYLWEKFPPSFNISQKTGNMSARDVMQIFGTDIMRNMFNNSIWVKACLRKIKRENPPIAIISDLRFPSELDTVLESNGYIIRLSRDLFYDQHPSETSLDNYDWSQNENCLVINSEVDINKKNISVVNWISKILEAKR